MIGNDIVDIATARSQSNWKHPRYLNKLFTSREQAYIHNSQDAFTAVWRLWTMKEAAYKLYTRYNPGRFYNPRAFDCTIAGDGGEVRFQDQNYYTQTRISAEYILSEARPEPDDFSSKVIAFRSEDCSEQGRFLKAEALEYLAYSRNIPLENLRVESCPFGIPKIIHNSTSIPVSFTHHGQYGAFAIS